MTESSLPTDENSTDQRFAHLPFADRLVAEVANRPNWVVYGLATLVSGVAWLWLVIVSSGISAASSVTDLGPASYLTQHFVSLADLNVDQRGWIGWLIRLCTPQFAETHSLTGFLVGYAMWSTMAIAMMLPSATPMLRTYADIADVARGQGKSVVPVLVLLAGYLTNWLLFSLAAALLQFGLVALSAVPDAVTPLQGAVGGSLLLVAGLYQFSDLKDACLEKCRNPFSTLFGQWSEKPKAVFRLGLEQGLFCLGCCWALMLVMFVVGTMNLAWMAFFALFTVLEKSVRGKVTSRVSGGILLAWGGILMSLSVLSAN